MAIISTGNVEILITKTAFDPLAQGMAQLAAEPSGITIPCRQGVSQVIR